jgi:hypothetical protein
MKRFVGYVAMTTLAIVLARGVARAGDEVGERIALRRIADAVERIASSLDRCR